MAREVQRQKYLYQNIVIGKPLWLAERKPEVDRSRVLFQNPLKFLNCIHRCGRNRRMCRSDYLSPIRVIKTFARQGVKRTQRNKCLLNDTTPCIRVNDVESYYGNFFVFCDNQNLIYSLWTVCRITFRMRRILNLRARRNSLICSRPPPIANRKLFLVFWNSKIVNQTLMACRFFF